MKIVVVGTRGIPAIQGGVETHCSQLYPRLAAMGHDVTVIRRTPYVTADNRIDRYRGVRLADVYAPRRKSIEAVVHTFLALLKARRMNPDVVHIHAIGPALLTPFARLLGLKVVMTNHGPDYDRQKWGRLAKTVLRTGERWGTRRANGVIVISKVIARILADNYGRRDTDLIYNGVETPDLTDVRTDYIEGLGLRSGGYMLAMGRFVEEKGFHDLVAAYRSLGSRMPLKLVIAGDADHPDAYSRSLKEQARAAGAVLTGFISGEPLHQLLAGAALFVMPSYHEGLPIALLEAMSYRLDVLTSDIPSCMLPELTDSDHFPTGDVPALAEAIMRKTEAAATPRTYDLSAYDWDHIARQTEAVYRRVTGLEK